MPASLKPPTRLCAPSDIPYSGKTSGFFSSFFISLFDIIPLEAFSNVHSQYDDIIMIQWFACMFGRNTQHYKKFLLVDHDALIDYVGILTALGNILLVDGESELANPVGHGVVARNLPKGISEDTPQISRLWILQFAVRIRSAHRSARKALSTE